MADQGCVWQFAIGQSPMV